jgi:hypothetical protein
MLGFGGKYLADYGNYNVKLNTYEFGVLYSNPLPFKLEPPAIFNYGSYLRNLIWAAPEGMLDPDAHHILFKEGNGAAQKVLVKEGQAVPRRFDIDSIFGVENLTWAPKQSTAEMDARIALASTIPTSTPGKFVPCRMELYGAKCLRNPKR